MESNDSPEIPDRGKTSDIPGLPSGAKVRDVNQVQVDLLEERVNTLRGSFPNSYNGVDLRVACPPADHLR